MTGRVIRKWCALVRRADLKDWEQTYRDRVLDAVRKLEGFHRVMFLADRDMDPCRVTVLMEWDSMDAERRFAGDEPSRAVVPDFMKRFFVQADTEASFHDVLLQESSV